MNNVIFALDIGTRSVNGLLVEVEGKSFSLIDYESIEHEERAMLDGQIHDVLSVAKVINKVKQKLEDRHHITLDKVCVAAAGRSLKTRRIVVTEDIKQQPLLDQESISFLELSAVQKAQYELAQEEKKIDQNIHYYCVGYSVLQYKLDHDVIGSLIDQQGDVAEVEIIATFLPKVVVESLLSALSRADLTMDALTLEPIAAINVLIPESMRRLNIALVDIGAGTSDIAITDEGTITAYGMVSKAGDEITEAISDYYLLDFNDAERVKREITEIGQATVSDILGFETEITEEELSKNIRDTIEELATSIANEIIELNKRAPKAVMLVGGGSLTPRLTTALAKKLNLPENRVATRGTDAIKDLKTKIEIPKGPEFITPIGIAIAAKQNPVHYISVMVNNRSVRLFDMKQLTVGDSLLAAGIEIKKMYGKPGMAYMVTVNNQSVTLPGTHGEPPRIYLNGEVIHVDDQIKHGDELFVEKGADGNPPHVTVEDIIGKYDPYTISFNGEQYQVLPEVKINESEGSFDTVVKDHDMITVKPHLTLKEWLERNQFNYVIEKNNSFQIKIDEENVTLDAFSAKLLLNDKEATLSQTLKKNDKIFYQPMKALNAEVLAQYLNLELTHSLNVTFNNKPVTITKAIRKMYKDQHVLSENDNIEPLSTINIKELEDEATTFVFQDVFRYVELNVHELKGNVMILINGQPATFLDEITAGDQLEVTTRNKVRVTT